jgi:hypothetical protein
MTGIRASAANGGQLHSDDGTPISDSAARKAFRLGFTIAAPNAGAGSFRQILARLGYQRVTVEDWTSSAGDWSFIVSAGIVTQTNRHPYFGFTYYLHRRSS